MYVIDYCYNLFIDVYGSLYCSLSDHHQVVKKLFNAGSNSTRTIAGNGSAGSKSNMLRTPIGIFVDFQLNLYVADCGNDRIQFFPLGQINGTTVVGKKATGTITLDCPMGLILDSNGYLFITDTNNNRIVGSGPNGYRCIVGCDGNGSAANQLSHPRMINFDSYGNLFVVDALNNRIQKFVLVTNSCTSKYSNVLFETYRVDHK